MQAIGKALWYIESNFDEPLMLDEIASVSGFSRFHLSRTFAAVVGQTFLAYARGRRLTWAARQLAGARPTFCNWRSLSAMVRTKRSRAPSANSSV